MGRRMGFSGTGRRAGVSCRSGVNGEDLKGDRMASCATSGTRRAGRISAGRIVVLGLVALSALVLHAGTTSSIAFAACPNEQFRVGPSAHLPDCRAYELVTPNDLNGIPQAGMANGAESARFMTSPVLASGDSYVWQVTPTGIPGTESSGYANLYAAQRTEAGWVSSRLSPS